ncbi:MAG TPA: DUF3306 domain-containing protein [Pseudolabrys sp.]|nr:DUF3306 domain-containing protein [Pseudolabrys sp.]
MSEPENFLERWSRRKREAVAPSPVVKPEKAGEGAAVERIEPAASKAEAPKDEEHAFDVSKLPPIESIGANSDVRAFMQPGVPPELKHAALRRAWSADAEIRDFIGLVENGWDFNDPNGVPGFGPLGKEDIARLLAQAVGEPEPTTGSDVKPVKTTDARSANDASVSDSDAPHSTKDVGQAAHDTREQISDEDSRERRADTATQNEATVASTHPAKRRRGHGGALPT